MARNLPHGLQDLLSRPYKQIESHSTLQLTIQHEEKLASYYLATAWLTVSGIAYAGHLRETSEINTSITRSADRANVRIQNADTLLGVELFDLADYLYASECVIGRFYLDKLSGSTFHHEFLTGAIVDIQPDQDFVELAAVADPYAPISVGAFRQISKLCQFTYGDASTCQSTSTKTSCNYRLTDTDGCAGRHSSTDNRAKCGCFAYLDPQVSVAAN